MIVSWFKRKTARLFATAADIGSLFMALIYVAYVGLLLYARIGYMWLNWVMLGLTLIYIGFFLFKIFYLNSINTKNKVRKITNMSYKYTKLGMRTINAIFVVVGLVNVRVTEKHIVALVGVIVVAISLVIAVLWDIIFYLIKKKIRELSTNWNSLKPSQKKDRIELFITSFIRSLDNIAQLDDYIEVGINATKMVGDKIDGVKGEKKNKKDDDGKIEDKKNCLTVTACLPNSEKDAD